MIARYHHYIVTAATGLGEKFTSAAAEQLHDTLCRNKMDEAKALLEAGMRPDEDTLLTAIWKNKADWVKLFMDHDVKPTPLSLTYTRHYRNPEIRDILLGARLVPGEDEMKKAVHEKLAETVKAYIAHGAQPTAEMVDDAARKNWDIETAKVLLEAGVVPEAKTLEFVVGYKRDNFAKRFFADSRKPKTPKSDWIKLLTAAGAAPTADMLGTAIRNNDEETARALLAASHEHKAKQARQPRKKLVLSKPAAAQPKLVLRKG